MPMHAAQPNYPPVGAPQPMAGTGYFPGQQGGAPAQPMHAPHAPGLQLAQGGAQLGGAPLQLSQTRSQPRPALHAQPQMAQPMTQPVAQPMAQPMQQARPAPRPQQRAAPAKARAAQPKAQVAVPPKKRGKLTPILVVAGAGVGAVLAWVLMNVL